MGYLALCIIVIMVGFAFTYLRSTDGLNNDYINKRKKLLAKMCISGVISLISVSISIYTDANWKVFHDGITNIFIAICVISIFFFITFWLSQPDGEKIKKDIELKEKQDNLVIIQNNYDIKQNEINIPNKTKLVEIKQGVPSLKIRRGKNYFWRNGNTVMFFPIKPEIDTVDFDNAVSNYTLSSINFDKIEYFSASGEKYHENKITGGGGGGSSIAGAVVGGVIAGSTGAIIGSRQKNDPISSELITHDNRETFINYFNDNDDRESIILSFDDYITLVDTIPEKEYATVMDLKKILTIEKIKNNSDVISVAEQIREFAKLKDEGILTEEEFTLKKQALLK